MCHFRSASSFSALQQLMILLWPFFSAAEQQYIYGVGTVCMHGKSTSGDAIDFTRGLESRNLPTANLPVRVEYFGSEGVYKLSK